MAYTASNRKTETIHKKMPLIIDLLPNIVFYLYKDEASAKSGREYGGTGFFVCRNINGKYVYAITNSHVIKEGYSTIRVNRIDRGKPDIIPLTERNWISHSGNADVSAAFVQDSCQYNFESLNANYLLTKDMLNSQDNCVFLGEEVYMLGLFSGSAGINYNRPVARSGIISQLPHETERIIYDKSGVTEPQEAFLMEMHSISGFSGSPVFYNKRGWIDFSAIKTILERAYDLQPKREPDDRPFLLLGIDAGGFSSWSDVHILDGNAHYPAQYQVKSPSGFSVVIPSWKIWELLLQDEMTEPIKKD